MGLLISTLILYYSFIILTNSSDWDKLVIIYLVVAPLEQLHNHRLVIWRSGSSSFRSSKFTIKVAIMYHVTCTLLYFRCILIGVRKDRFIFLWGSTVPPSFSLTPPIKSYFYQHLVAEQLTDHICQPVPSVSSVVV